MNRRDSFKTLALGAGLAASPVAAMTKPAPARVFDSRFALSRAFGAAAPTALDCHADAAHTWFTALVGPAFPAGGAEGLTTQADAMILADLAQRDGRRVTIFARPAGTDLVHWLIA